jgi:hypothetical protein
VACHNEAGLACLGFLARAQRNEVSVAIEHATDLGQVSHAVVGLAQIAKVAMLGAQERAVLLILMAPRKGGLAEP